MSSTLAYGFNRKDILFYSKQKFHNYYEILNQKKLFNYHFKKIESSHIKKIINNNNSKTTLEDWVGHPLIYNEKQDEFYI